MQNGLFFSKKNTPSDTISAILPENAIRYFSYQLKRQTNAGEGALVFNKKLFRHTMAYVPDIRMGLAFIF
ncbi:MAG: hypothetical protein D6714_02550 [Bacteroidetes bacterium]|nr:MAG: hypothetical protein D6714_02550 [Bacteroidota bacterium]